MDQTLASTGSLVHFAGQAQLQTPRGRGGTDGLCEDVRRHLVERRGEAEHLIRGPVAEDFDV